MGNFVFFDIGGTIGSPIFSASPVSLVRIEVYPFAGNVLRGLRTKGIPIGIISNTGNESFDELVQALARSGLEQYLEKELLVFSSVSGLKKDSPEVFRVAAERASQCDPSADCIFVGEDSRERTYALEAGWRVCPHPLLVADVIDGDSLNYVKIVAPMGAERPWRDSLRSLSVVPLYVTGPEGQTLYAIIPRRKIATLANLRFDVQVIGASDDPLSTDLFFLKDDLAAETGYLSGEGQAAQFMKSDETSGWIRGATEEGLLVALPGLRSVEDYHFKHARHGHNLKLVPDPSLLVPFGVGVNSRETSWLRLEREVPSLSRDELQHLSGITAAEIVSILDRYAGITNLGDDDDRPVSSRHIYSADNARTVAQLARDLQDIGGGQLSVAIHSFTHEALTLSNVIAELGGEASDEFVLVTAHLDSTAANSRPYNPLLDPAPGADDDASGVAGVLAIAKVMLSLSAERRPKRSIRFILFNAEEHGLIGSNAYARDAAAAEDGIKAVFQMDMIGYNKKAPRSFEVHVGFRSSSDVQARSRILAERMSSLTAWVAPDLEAPQVYPGTDGVDPADGRSDHASFHQRGYAACVTSEDFFLGPSPDSPIHEDNPDYHKRTDTFVDPEYAADVARVVAAAAWVSARD